LRKGIKRRAEGPLIAPFPQDIRLVGSRLISVPHTVLMYPGDTVSVFPTVLNAQEEVKKCSFYTKRIFSNALLIEFDIPMLKTYKLIHAQNLSDTPKLSPK